VPFFVPVAVVQWLWLRHKVKSASLWALSALVSALLFSMARGDAPFSFSVWWYVGYGVLAAAALFYSGVTGATMLYLQTQAYEKAKNDLSQVEQADVDDAERLTRLSNGTVDREGKLSDVSGSASTAQSVL
jgi:hypothetical protein